MCHAELPPQSSHQGEVDGLAPAQLSAQPPARRESATTPIDALVGSKSSDGAAVGEADKKAQCDVGGPGALQGHGLRGASGEVLGLEGEERTAEPGGVPAGRLNKEPGVRGGVDGTTLQRLRQRLSQQLSQREGRGDGGGEGGGGCAPRRRD